MMGIRQWAVADSYTTERGIAPRLVYTASLGSSWNWLELLRLRTLARFLVWGRLCLEMEGPSKRVGQAFECSRPSDPAYSSTSCHPGIILVDIDQRAQGLRALLIVMLFRITPCCRSLSTGLSVHDA